MSMKDMVTNGLDLSLQNQHISFGKRTQKLAMENFFLIHRWSKEEMPYALYTEGELAKIHRNFGHPSVKSTEGLLKRAGGGKIGNDLRDAIGRIATD